jgi:4'-phosphopantetheinyl transferase EntD
MIEQLLPDYVACAECDGDDASAFLLRGEAAALGRAVASRVREFTTARCCARRALEEFVAPPVALLSGPDREPLWPEGYVGSITHCDGYRGAAVARRRDALSIGIDAEIHEPLPPEILSLVTVDAERAWLSRAPAGVHWDRLIFSAKESVYKAWFPLTHTWLDFGDVCVTVDVAAAGFRASLLDPPQLGGRAPDSFEGRFRFTLRHIFTAIAVAP